MMIMAEANTVRTSAHVITVTTRVDAMAGITGTIPTTGTSLTKKDIDNFLIKNFSPGTCCRGFYLVFCFPIKFYF
jgi:hypothetical protein